MAFAAWKNGILRHCRWASSSALRWHARWYSPAKLLLLDEPFSALDAPLRARLRRELLALQQEVAATTVLVTHDPLEAALLADELVVLENGRVLQAGSTDEIFRRPANVQVARLLGADNVAAGIVVAPDRIAVGQNMAVAVAARR